MLAIIFCIMKIIGIILLGILGLLLFLVLLVLLVPIRYRADGSYYGRPKARASVSWLLHILSLRVEYEQESDICVRVFGIRLRMFDRKDTSAEKPSEEKLPEAEPQNNQVPEAAEAWKKPPADEVQNDPLREEEWNAAGQSDKTRRQPEQPSDRRNPFEKLRITIQEICDKLKSVKQKKEEWTEFLTRDENKKTFRLVWRQLRAVIKHVLPGKIEGRVRFGFDDPYKTGQVLMYIGPFYGFYAKHLDIIPVFDEPVLEGELRLRGRIRIGTMLALAVRILLDKNFRKLIGRFRKA